MSQLRLDDALGTRRRPRYGADEEVSLAAQQAGLAALISIAQRIDQGGGGAPQHGWTAVDAPRRPAWLVEHPRVDIGGPRSNASPGTGVARRTDTGALILQVKRLSSGMVEKVSRYGPVISRKAPPQRRLSKGMFSDMLSSGDRALIAFLSVCWALCLADFWIWWLEPSHRVSTVGIVWNSIVLFYLTCYPVFYVVAANRLRNVSRSVPVPRLRVAFIVTRAPSEPWNVARATLTAMLNQDFPLPYDVWLADESPTAEILRWCFTSGVIVSSRQGVEDYHRPSWPRRTKCKEGNLAYFYDHWGYRSYDVVAQLDCDHRPSVTYLAEMVRPFADPAVGYVAAPSVCDANAAESWAARGRLYREATFHGAFQLGHSAGWAPACIGSHYAVRTAALRDIGGVGPELAEDFSTSFLLNSAGWHGTFAIDAEAHGDGPSTFAAMLVQEFQWSKSLTVVFLKLVPGNLRRLSWSLRLRFLYALLFYTLLVVSTLGGVLLAPVAAVTGIAWVNVNYAGFLLHWWSLSVWLILMTVLLRRRGLLRPQGAPIFSWENWLYTLVRWPYITRGIFAAIRLTIRPRTETFKVTPKGAGGLESLPTNLMFPFILVSLGCSAAAITGESINNAAGYVFLCILGGLLYATVSMLVPVLHAREMAARARVPGGMALRRTSIVPLLLGIFALLPAMYALIHYPAYAQHIFHWHWAQLSHWQWQSVLH
jgi:cellulose synthase (UDP-forming)